MLRNYTDNDNYYGWLIDKICEYDYDPLSYQLVLEKMYNTEFYPVIERDENRVEDGLALYSAWTRECDVPFDGPYVGYEDRFCSVLEMMIALAEDIEYDYMYDPDEGNRVSLWFWVMMENLGLVNYDDDRYNEDKVEQILLDLCERTFDKDGYGGLFMTENEEFDERSHEIWDQAMHYLMEFWYD